MNYVIAYAMICIISIYIITTNMILEQNWITINLYHYINQYNNIYVILYIAAKLDYVSVFTKWQLLDKFSIKHRETKK